MKRKKARNVSKRILENRMGFNIDCWKANKNTEINYKRNYDDDRKRVHFCTLELLEVIVDIAFNEECKIITKWQLLHTIYDGRKTRRETNVYKK